MSGKHSLLYRRLSFLLSQHVGLFRFSLRSLWTGREDTAPSGMSDLFLSTGTMGSGVFYFQTFLTLWSWDNCPKFSRRHLRRYFLEWKYRPSRITTIVHGISVMWLYVFPLLEVKTSRPRQNGHQFADDIFKSIFLNENVWISIKISMKFVPTGPINNIPALVQIRACRRPGNKPLPEPLMVRLSTNICITRPQLVNPMSPWLMQICRWCFVRTLLLTNKQHTANP